MINDKETCELPAFLNTFTKVGQWLIDIGYAEGQDESQQQMRQVFQDSTGVGARGG